MYRHVSGQVVVSVEDLPALRAGVGLLFGGETLLCRHSSHLPGLGEGKGREPEVRRGRGRGRGGVGREEGPPGVSGPQQGVVPEEGQGCWLGPRHWRCGRTLGHWPPQLGRRPLLPSILLLLSSLPRLGRTSVKTHDLGNGELELGAVFGRDILALLLSVGQVSPVLLLDVVHDEAGVSGCWSRNDK